MSHLGGGNAQPPAVVHVDLDGAKHIFRNSGWPYAYAEDPLFTSGLRNLLAFFEHNGIRATLFVIAEDLDDAEKRPLLEEAVRGGHEIASHSLTHPRLNTLAADGKKREIVESRRRLEAELDTHVAGFRAPSYSIDRECLGLLTEAGYAWDSSVFPLPAFSTRLGGDVPTEPFQPAGAGELWELPLPRYKPGPIPFHPCYALIAGRAYFRWRLGAFRRLGVPLVWLFHLTDLADPLPPQRLRGWKSKLLTLSHLSATTKARRCQTMVDVVRQHYRIIPTSQLIQERGA